MVGLQNQLFHLVAHDAISNVPRNKQVSSCCVVHKFMSIISISGHICIGYHDKLLLQLPTFSVNVPDSGETVVTERQLNATDEYWQSKKNVGI